MATFLRLAWYMICCGVIGCWCKIIVQSNPWASHFAAGSCAFLFIVFMVILQQAGEETDWWK